MNGRTNWADARWFVWALPAVYLWLTLIGSCLFALQGGFGGGHGRFDIFIGLSGLPSILLLDYLPLPEWILRHDLLLIVWCPALANIALAGLVAVAIRAVARRAG